MTSTVATAHQAVSAGISIRDLRVEYRPGSPILNELNAEISPGEILALVGASGCGKSTLLRAIAQLLPISSGQIVFEADGEVSQNVAPGLCFPGCNTFALANGV